MTMTAGLHKLDHSSKAKITQKYQP